MTIHELLYYIRRWKKRTTEYLITINFILTKNFPHLKGAIPSFDVGSLVIYTRNNENASNRNCLWSLAFLFVQNCKMRKTIKFLFYINTLNSIIN